MTVLVVTGTDTGVGKTITTAALAAGMLARGHTVAVYKPTQAGLEDGLGDVDHVRRLAGVTTAVEGIRLPHPMAPVTAAAKAGIALPDLPDHQHAIDALAAGHDHVLVEGAGGLLVQLDGRGSTLADLAAALSAPVLVVCRSGLGTLNHTALTIEVLKRRRILIAGLVIGAWPNEPTEIDVSNRAHLGPLLGAIPEGAGGLDPARFRTQAAVWLKPPRTFRRLGRSLSDIGPR